MAPRPAPRPDRLPKISRRRAIQVIAAAAGLPVVAGLGSLTRGVRAADMFVWQGVALGSPAKLTLAHPDRARAERAAELCVGEIERLEAIFSLYRSDSELNRLNRDGSVTRPSRDLVQLLEQGRRFSEATGGAFDVTVQPLWQVYADHFATRPGTDSTPDAAAIDRARTVIGYRRVKVSDRAVGFDRPGMAVTMNGIAQGYITDRVADLLRAEGFSHVLVELGETRALDDHPEARPWRIGLADPYDPGKIVRTIDLDNRAVSTSAGIGTRFDAAGRYHHLFDPASGLCPNHHLSVSVIADRATSADALSTALFVMAPGAVEPALAKLGNIQAFVTDSNGRTRVIES